MKEKTKRMLTVLGILPSAILCRYIWEYINPWLGLISIVLLAYLSVTTIYKSIK